MLPTERRRVSWASLMARTVQPGRHAAGPAIQSAGRAPPRARHRHRGDTHRRLHRSAVRRARARRKADRCAADVARRRLHPDPRFPERSTIYASDGKTVLATLYLDNREIVGLGRHQPDREQVGPGGGGRAVLPTRTAGLDLARPRAGHERRDGRGGAGRIHDHAAAREERHHRRHPQTFQRKFQELALAIRVEQRYTKDQILELYLNDVYFGTASTGSARRRTSTSTCRRRG